MTAVRMSETAVSAACSSNDDTQNCIFLHTVHVNASCPQAAATARFAVGDAQEADSTTSSLNPQQQFRSIGTDQQVQALQWIAGPVSSREWTPQMLSCSTRPPTSDSS